MFIFDGIIGIFLWPARLLTCLLGDIIGLILGLTKDGATVTMEDVLFNQVDNKVPILNINFFEKVTTSGAGADAVNAIRDNISLWYTALRNLSIVLIAIIVIYVGLRMALATIAADQAKYKTMLIDWLKSLALLFVLHILILLVITVNDALVKTIYGGLTSTSSGMADLSSKLHDIGVAPFESFSVGAGCAIGYLILQILTFLFFVTYVKRMVNIAFLITIAPLVTITYSIDKMKDGRSQAFDTWFKQFWTSVLIQPFQCIAFIVLGSSAYKVMVPEGSTFMATTSLSTMIVGIVMIGFILSAENIVREIFGVRPNGIGRAAENMAMLTALSGVGKKAVSFGGNAIKKSGAGKKLGNKFNTSAFGKYLQNNPKTREALLTAGKTITKANTIATGAFTGLAQGGATERFGDEFLFALKGIESGNQINKEFIDAGAREHRLARAFNDYYYYNEGMTAAEAANHCDQMLEGDITEESIKEEIKTAKETGASEDTLKALEAKLTLFNTLHKATDPSIKDESKRNKDVMDIVKKIQKGEIGEYIGNPATAVIGGITPESRWGRGLKDEETSSSSTTGSGSSGPGLDSGSDSGSGSEDTGTETGETDNGGGPGLPSGREPAFEDESTPSGLPADFDQQLTSRLEDFRQTAERMRSDIHSMESNLESLTDRQRQELDRLRDSLRDIESDINTLEGPSSAKRAYQDIARQIEEIENGNTDVQGNLDELMRQRDTAKSNYDIAVERARGLMESNTDGGNDA